MSPGPHFTGGVELSVFYTLSGLSSGATRSISSTARAGTWWLGTRSFANPLRTSNLGTSFSRPVASPACASTPVCYRQRPKPSGGAQTSIT